MISQASINEMASSLSETVIRIRRDFHQHPELGFEEKRTSSVIAEYLKGLGLEVWTGIAGTGVVGLLHGASDERALELGLKILAAIAIGHLSFKSSIESPGEIGGSH
jgi:metal-dependent amidase/aminoacylase/carboxypeptidase family protein